jgi:hypothetical protein
MEKLLILGCGGRNENWPQAFTPAALIDPIFLPLAFRTR